LVKLIIIITGLVVSLAAAFKVTNSTWRSRPERVGAFKVKLREGTAINLATYDTDIRGVPSEEQIIGQLERR
jgi:hypothetical protein